jgi:hypothetical protein
VPQGKVPAPVVRCGAHAMRTTASTTIVPAPHACCAARSHNSPTSVARWLGGSVAATWSWNLLSSNAVVVVVVVLLLLVCDVTGSATTTTSRSASSASSVASRCPWATTAG